MNPIECLALFVIAALVTLLLVPVAKWVAERLDAIDYPSARRVNKEPIPRMGGIAMLGGLAAALCVVLVGISVFGWETPFVPHASMNVNYPGVGISILVMFCVGALDDVVSLRPKVKLAGQLIAACVAAGSGLLLSNISNPFAPGFIEFGILAYPITVFYLVAFANVINLIDGLDGLAAGITAISASTIFVFAMLTGRYDAALVSVALAGVCVGFLRYNFNPASIFMGDSGALLLGFTLGVASLLAVARSALFVSLLVPLLAAGVPIIDTALAIVRRVRAHKPIDEADRGHIHHRLLQAGYTQRATVIIMWIWTAVLSLCSVLITWLGGTPRLVAMAVAAGVTAFGILKLHLVEPVLIHHYHPRERGRLTNRQDTAGQRSALRPSRNADTRASVRSEGTSASAKSADASASTWNRSTSTPRQRNGYERGGKQSHTRKR